MDTANCSTLTERTTHSNSAHALYVSAPFFACIGLVGALPWIAG